MGEQHRNLVLMRHAKSAYPEGIADRERPLAPRGIREARLAGDWLRAHVPAIDTVLCSSAARTRETLAHTGICTPARYLDQLYGVAPDTVLEEINRINDETTTLLVLGHEPATSAVTIGLAGAENANNEAVQRVSGKFSTSGIAVLRVPGRWEQLKFGGAILVAFHVPR